MEVRTEPQLILTDLKVKDSEEVITKLADLLNDHGYVKDSFLGAVLEREKIFATGLPTPEYHVAIPHTDAEHVIKPGFAVAVLKEPVLFGEMGTEDSLINVNIVCMLALKKNDMLVEFLQILIEMFQKLGFLRSLIDVSPQVVADLFNNQLTN